MTALDHLPVLLLGHRGDVLARNAPAASRCSACRWSRARRSCATCSSTRGARERIVNWADFAQAAVAALRREAGRRPHDRRLLDLIDDLRAADADVARWWDDHAVRDYASVAKRIQHPEAGRARASTSRSSSAPHEPDQRLVVYTAQPDSPTARVLPILASWAVPVEQT